MKFIIGIKDFEKEEFMEFADVNSKIEIDTSSAGNSGGLNITMPEIITVVSSTVTVVELSRLLIAWLRKKSKDTVSIKSRSLDIEITIKNEMSEENVVELISDIMNKSEYKLRLISYTS